MGDSQKRRFSPTRTIIESKLVQDEQRLTELQSNLDSSEKLTGDMVNILDSFTSRLKKLDDTILPVYNETLQLTRLQDNIQKTLSFMERVIGFYHVSEDVDVKIREGPSGNIEVYMTQLNKLREAVDHFQHFNDESLELEHLNELFYTGREALIREFLQLLKKHSKPVHVAILHDIAYSEDTEDALPAIILLPSRVVTDLNVIADYLVKAPGENQTDIMSVYAQIRCNQLGRAMSSLVQSGQGESLLSPSIPSKKTFASSFLKAGHTPNRKTGHRKVASGGGSTGGGGGAGGGAILPAESTSLSVHDESLEGCSSFMIAATVFLQLIRSEVSLMKEVIPFLHHTHVLDNLIRQPVDFFMSQGDTLYQQARKSVAHNEYSVVVSSLRLLRHIKTLLPLYRVVLQNLESKPSDRLLHLMQQFDKLCCKALQEGFIQYIKIDSEKLSNLPKDGTVHSLTSSTMRFIESLLEYVDLLGDIFQGQNSFSLANGMSEDEKRKSIGQYLVRVLDALNLNMENKARNFESPYLAALFLLNNFQFVLKTFTQNERLSVLLEEGFPEVENHYIGLISQQGRNYQRGFQKLISYLGQEMSLANISSGDKLSNQKRQLLKEKFKGFNSELDELLRIQKDWSIPDAVLRNRVREDNINLILPLYAAFYEMFGTLNFTKNYDKYLKHTPSSLNHVLLTVFDGGAS